jgi:thymidylate kinase
MSPGEALGDSIPGTRGPTLPEAPSERALRLVQELCRGLDAEAIDWCHWKSNVALDRSASGENDLDLLVARADAAQFEAVLSRLGFKEARLPPERELPGIRNFYGYDSEAHRLVHVHAHTQLVLGHDTTKNVRLPLEGPYLRSCSAQGLFRVPSPEFEYCVLIVRMMLKYSTWDAILCFDARLSAGERRELEDLAPRVNRGELHRIVEQHLPYIGAELLDECAESLRPGASLWSRYRAGRELLAGLRAHARRPPSRDTPLRIWRRFAWALRRRLLGRVTRRLAAGGAVIAIVGGDGSGKSTAVDEVCRWLGRVFAVRRVHMGEPRPSWSRLAAKTPLEVARAPAARALTRWPGAMTPFARFRPYVLAARHILTARDRYRAYHRARRFATDGGIVITDRYPLAQVRSMDGARAASVFPQGDRLAGWLVRMEQAFYRHIPPPDVLVVLRVDPEIVTRRRSDQDQTWVRARAEEVWTLDWQPTGAAVVDGGRPWPVIHTEVQSLIWSRL